MLYLACKCMIVLYLCALKGLAAPTPFYLVTPNTSALVPQSFHDKAMQTQWLKIREICPFKVMEAQKSELEFQQSYTPSKKHQGRIFDAFSFWLQPAILGLEMFPSNLYLHLHMTFFPVCFYVFWSSHGLLIRTPSLDFRSILIQYDLIITNHICKYPISK